MAFTRTPATGSPATYTGTADVDTLVLLDQPSDITISGLAANDVITVGAAALAVNSLSNFKVYGNDGTDIISVTAALLTNSLIQGGNGKDVISMGGANLVNSIVRGGADDDTINTFNMNQSTAQGSIGNDTLNINGNVFSSRVYGGADEDIINIQNVVARNSRFNGSKGADTINVGLNADLLQSSAFGGEGNDVINVNFNTSASFYSGDLGNDDLTIAQNTEIDTKITSTVLGGDGNDKISLSATNTSVTYDVTGGKGADSLLAGVNSVDAITFNRGDSVASTAQNFGDAFLNNGDTITFADGVDTITGFGGAGSTRDTVNVDISTPTTLVTISNNTILTDILASNTIYAVRGTYVGNLFTVNNGAVGALYVVGGGGLTIDQSLRSSTNIFVSTNALLGSADFT